MVTCRLVFLIWLVWTGLASTAERAAGQGCTGDCNSDGRVVISELILGVNIALGTAAQQSCLLFDANASGGVTIEELIAAVNNALVGCAGTPTPTPTVLTPTPTPTELTLAPIGHRHVALGSTLRLQLAAFDPLDRPLAFSAAPLPLPAHASLDGHSGQFTFAPGAEQVGDLTLTFSVKAGASTDSETVTISVLGPQPGGETALSGQLLDTTDFVRDVITPVVGATVSIVGTDISTVSDASGRFLLRGMRAGLQVFDIDSSTAHPAPDGSRYAGFHQGIQLLEGVTNVVERPFFLPRLAAESFTEVNPDATTVVSNPTLGVALTIPADTARAEDGLPFDGTLSISAVPGGFAPEALPENLQPGILVTIQPLGVTFDTPVPITFPNVDGLKPGTETDLWSLNPETGQFAVVGRGRVSGDGLRIETISGGVRAADWHFPLPPSGATSTQVTGRYGRVQIPQVICTKPFGSNVTAASGCLDVDVTLPYYMSLGETRATRLVYSSQRAHPYPVIPFNATIPLRAAVPPRLSFQLTFGGVRQGTESFIDTGGLNENLDETVRAATSIDASNLATAVYPYSIHLTSHYAESRVSSTIGDDLPLVNEQSSPFGAGWGLDGLQRLYPQPRDRVLLTDGNGGLVLFGHESETTVDGKANIFGAGRQAPPAPGGGGPGVSPTEFRFSPEPGQIIRFVQAGGSVGCCPGPLQNGPDGSDLAGGVTDIASFGGISGLIHHRKTMFLAGVFLSDQEPMDPPPPRVDFTDNEDFDRLAPPLNQTFFVGDGRTASGVVQEFEVPAGATRLLLGFVDGFNFQGLAGFYHDNSGQLAVTIEASRATAQATRFTSSAGESSVLERAANGTFTRTLSDGTVVSFDAHGLQTALTDGAGNRTTYAYDAMDRLTSITDPAGRMTKFDYLGNHLTSVTDPAARRSTFEHDASGNLVAVQYPDGTRRTFDYDARHLMVRETDPRGSATMREYDAYGRAVKAILADGTIRQATAAQLVGLIDPQSGQGTPDQPAPVQRESSAVSLFSDGEQRMETVATGQFGEVRGATDAAGLAVRIERDFNGMPTRMVFPSGHAFTSTYDSTGNRLSITDELLGATTRFTYTPGFAWLTSITSPRGHTKKFTYDDRGNLTGIQSPLGRVNAFSYDDRGLLVSQTDLLGTETRLEYDAQGNPALMTQGVGSAHARVAHLGYTAAGQLSSLTDGVGRVSTLAFDDAGRVIQQTRPDGNAIDFTYDPAGNVTSITPPGRPPHVFRYTPLNLLAEYAPPATANATAPTRYTYDKAQELSRVTRPDGTTVDFAYDAAGRLSSVTLPTGTLTYAYDPNTGQLQTATAPGGGTLSYTYRGEFETQAIWSGDISGQFARTFDDEQRVSATFVNHAGAGLAYNADDLLVQLDALYIDRAPSSGLVTGTRLGLVTDERHYDEFGGLERYRAAYQNTTLYEAEYSYDAAARVVGTLETAAGVTATLAYAYDLAGRLTEVSKNGGAVEHYEYDANGNRVGGFNQQCNPIANASIDSQDRLLAFDCGATAHAYAYTANGELQTKAIAGASTGYVYDAFGNLLSVQLPNGDRIDYLIDAESRRIGKRVNGVLTQGFLYDGIRPVAELDGAGNVVARFYYGTQSNAPDFMLRSGTLLRFISDPQGSPRLVVDAFTGQVVQRMEYSASGAVQSDTNPGFQPFGFAGGLYDLHTGLLRFGSRDYDPATGRWTAKDPAGFSGESNLYVYAGNNPLNLLDPSGLITARQLLIFGAGAGVAALVVVTDGAGIPLLGGGLSSALAAAGFNAGSLTLAATGKALGTALLAGGGANAVVELATGGKQRNVPRAAAQGCFLAFGGAASVIVGAQALTQAGVLQPPGANPGDAQSRLVSAAIDAANAGNKRLAEAFANLAGYRNFDAVLKFREELSQALRGGR